MRLKFNSYPLSVLGFTEKNSFYFSRSCISLSEKLLVNPRHIRAGRKHEDESNEYVNLEVEWGWL